MLPTRDMIASIEDLNPEQVLELAIAYIDLMGMIFDALNACEHDHAFVRYNEATGGIVVTGHPPQGMLSSMMEAAIDEYLDRNVRDHR